MVANLIIDRKGTVRKEICSRKEYQNINFNLLLNLDCILLVLLLSYCPSGKVLYSLNLSRLCYLAVRIIGPKLIDLQRTEQAKLWGLL